MNNIEYKNNLIECLTLTAQSLFNVKGNVAKRAITKFLNSYGVPKNDPLINHGKFGPLTRKILLKYRILTDRQINRKLYA